MAKQTIILSLGGSLIVPDKVNYKFLETFKKILTGHKIKYRFVVVCGGGTVARKYISILDREHKNKKQQSIAGIRATRTNAELMMQLFGKEANDKIPMSMKEVKNQLAKNSIVFCGALRYTPNQTSDSTAAKLANYLKSQFINITNIDGLYSDNPLKNKNAKFIPKISWEDFDKIAKKINFKPGQHFVLDQTASKLILMHKITTYIIGPNPKNLDNIMHNKDFRGTIIRG